MERMTSMQRITSWIYTRCGVWALPSAFLRLAPDMKATDLFTTLDRLALDHATLTALVKR
jgi:hypothetical protein